MTKVACGSDACARARTWSGDSSSTFFNKYVLPRRYLEAFPSKKEASKRQFSRFTRGLFPGIDARCHGLGETADIATRDMNVDNCL
jgi:hypothetical protein